MRLPDEAALHPGDLHGDRPDRASPPGQAMILPVLAGLVAGARSMTPLAMVAWLAHRGKLPNTGPVPRLLEPGWFRAGATVLAVGELLGDKMRSAPDRVVALGQIARLLTGAIAGAALVRRRQQTSAALLGAAAALASSRMTFAVRSVAMQRFGQRPTGVVEDAIVLACALGIAKEVLRSRSRQKDRFPA